VALAFWMANASELLNFVRRDRDLCPITLQAQNTLAQLVQQAFRYDKSDVCSEGDVFLTV